MAKRKRADDTSAGDASAAAAAPPAAAAADDGDVVTAFLAWLAREGAVVHPDVELRRMPGFGLSVRVRGGAAGPAPSPQLPAHATIFRLPRRLCLSPGTALAHPAIGPALSALSARAAFADEVAAGRALCYALLLYEAAEGDASPWAPYLKLLPTLDELRHRHPCVMSLPQDRSRHPLQGTRITTTVVPRFLAELRKVYDTFIVPFAAGLFAQSASADASSSSSSFPSSSPPSSFSWERLLWAAGVYWSRAVLIPGAGTTQRRCEALTPLIDILNHRAGFLSRLSNTPPRGALASSHTSSSTRSGGGTAAAEPMIFYSCGRALPAGAQIFLNYGVRGNEELLSYFGFCLADNLADVVTLDLVGHGVARLYVEGPVPATLLDFARAACNSNSAGRPTGNAIHSVYKVPLQEKGGDVGGGGSAAWFAQLLREEAAGGGGGGSDLIDFDAIGTVTSAENEHQALKWVVALLDRRIADLGGDGGGGGGGGGGDPRPISPSVTPPWDAAFVHDVGVYKRGQVRVLRSARGWVERLCAKVRAAVPDP